MYPTETNDFPHLGPLMGCASHMARARMDARLEPLGVTPVQTRVLLYLHRYWKEHGASAPQGDVVAHLRVKPSTANGVLDRMEEKGLVERRGSAEDARRKDVSLTEEGRRRQRRLREVFLETEAMMVRTLTPQEVETLYALLGKVIKNLEEDGDEC